MSGSFDNLMWENRAALSCCLPFYEKDFEMSETSVVVEKRGKVAFLSAEKRREYLSFLQQERQKSREFHERVKLRPMLDNNASSLFFVRTS